MERKIYKDKECRICKDFFSPTTGYKVICGKKERRINMVKGFVANNTGRSRHIFKRTVYPGQRVSLEQVYKTLKSSVPEKADFFSWLKDYLPTGWEVCIEEPEKSDNGLYKEVLTAELVVTEEPVDLETFYQKDGKDSDSGEDRPSLEYARPKELDNLTSRDLYNLRLKDNPKRVIKQVNNVHKLRRALTMCRQDGRKSMLTRIIQHRLKDLSASLS